MGSRGLVRYDWSRRAPVTPGRPGEARADTLLVPGPNSWNGLTLEPRGVMEGRFRLVYDASSCRGDRDCRLPREMRSSDVFRVRVER